MGKEYYEVTICDYKKLSEEEKGVGARERRFGSIVNVDIGGREIYASTHNNQLSDETIKMLEIFFDTKDLSKRLEALALSQARKTGKYVRLRLEFE
ncbi:unnamed protein product [marine sediment metagenome]|uniref:Uncharacterized protein n=1 Tax=marine sediment metagenome TaxID=412755 RepID=X0ZI86_9ZZZZ